jgi:hypothetical protein
MSAFTPSLPAAAGSTPGAVGTLPTAPGPEGTLAALASRLGMSADALQSALKQGESIAGLAEHQGVPRDSVAEFVASQIQQARTSSGQPTLDQSALERMVNRALDRGRRPSSDRDGGETPSPTIGGVGAYASNARVTSAGVPAGRTVSLLA